MRRQQTTAVLLRTWRDAPCRFCSAGHDASAVARLLEKNPQLSQQVIKLLSPNARRHFLVTASSTEWFGQDQIRNELNRADADRDATISSSDYNRWIEDAVSKQNPIPLRTLCLVALQVGLPFVAFGFLDNSTMILSGDLIDEFFGDRFRLSLMGAAALGGVVSGTFGIQVHGLAERFVARLTWVPKPALRPAQWKAASVLRAAHIGGTVGIVVGLCLGMLPLLFIGG